MGLQAHSVKEVCNFVAKYMVYYLNYDICKGLKPQIRRTPTRLAQRNSVLKWLYCLSSQHS